MILHVTYPLHSLSYYVEPFLSFDEEDDLESDDILTFVTIIRDFLNNITANDITSVESWEASGRYPHHRNSSQKLSLPY